MHMHKALLGALIISVGVLAAACGKTAEASGKTDDQYRKEAMVAFQDLRQVPIPEIAEKKVAIIDSARAHVPDLAIEKDETIKYLNASLLNRAKAEADTIRRGLIYNAEQLDRVKSAMRADLARSGHLPTELMSERQVDVFIGNAIIKDGINRSGNALTVIDRSELAAKNREIANLRRQLVQTRSIRPQTKAAKKTVASRTRAKGRG